MRQIEQLVVRPVAFLPGTIANIDHHVALGQRELRDTDVDPVQGSLGPPGTPQIFTPQIAGEGPEFEHVLGAIAPVARTLVAGTIRAERSVSQPEFLAGGFDPAGRLRLFRNGEARGHQSTVSTRCCSNLPDGSVT
jgi:hypothetical protein